MDGVITTTEEGVRIIRFNRPERKNAVSPLLYAEIAKILNEDAKSDETVATIITGNGEYFTSGNDIMAVIQELKNTESSDPEVTFIKFKQFVESLINYPKILIAVVNGPAIGIGVTMLALCDIVYASDRATFRTPFINLGLCAEACSSYTFPRIMGRSRASEILLLDKTLSAEDARQYGLVSEVIPHSKLDELLLKLQGYGKLPVNTVRVNKALITGSIRDALCECNDREYKSLINAVSSVEFLNGVTSFLNRKSKL